MQRLNSLILGLLCCFSCSKNDPQDKNKELQAKSRGYHTAQENELTGARQPVIKAFKWGHTIIRMPNGELKETTDGTDWVLMPGGCQPWNYKQFGKGAQDQTMGHLWPQRAKDQQGTGVLPYAIKGLLDRANSSDITIIVSTGVNDDLGVSQAAKDYLEDLKTQNKIQAYYLLNSKKVPAQHNACVKANKKVYTLLHTTC